jgi:hypothetical protein
MVMTIAWGWRARSEALVPRAAVAWGEAARRLHGRLGALASDTGGRLSAVASRELLIVCSEPDLLPWVAGVAYAAPCPEAAALWMPTQREPDVPGDLLAAALQRQHRRAPLLLWPAPEAVVPLDRLMPVTPALLERIEEQWQR